MRVELLPGREGRERKRVAAYARVSTLQEHQEDSLETQVRYYEQRIRSSPEWVFVKVYADLGFSGGNAQKRPGFMEMIHDAEQGAFDLLLVRSISRFARNAREAQIYCRKLKALGVEARFEREHLSNMDASTEMAFHLLAACAQEESRITSERVKWGIRKRQELGIYRVGSRRIFGYDEIEGMLVPNGDAWVIAYLFAHYAAGESISQIGQALEQMGHRASPSTLRARLRNEAYVGDRRMQKQAPNHYLTHRPDWSQPYTSYYYADTHPGIVSRALWEQVQQRMDARGRKRRPEPGGEKPD